MDKIEEASKTTEVKMNYPPSVVVQYVKNWAEQNRKAEQNGPREIAMLDDIVRMIEIAASCMKPGPAEQGNQDKQK